MNLGKVNLEKDLGELGGRYLNFKEKKTPGK